MKYSSLNVLLKLCYKELDEIPTMIGPSIRL